MHANVSHGNNLSVFLTRHSTVVTVSALILSGGCSDDESPVKPELYSISGNVLVSWVERNAAAESLGTTVEDTVSGIKVYLTDNTQAVLDSAVTVSGAYRFKRVSKGSYRIAALKAPGVLQSTDLFWVDGENAPVSKNVPLGPSGGTTSFPNPFNVATIIAHDLSSDTHMVLNIYSIEGERVRRIADRMVPEGHHEWMWNGRNDSATRAPAGLYWSVLTTEYSSETHLIVKVDTGP